LCLLHREHYRILDQAYTQLTVSDDIDPISGGTLTYYNVYKEVSMTM